MLHFLCLTAYQSICTAGNLIQYASQMPLPVPQSSPYFPVGAGGYDFSTMRTSNMTLPAASVPAVPGVPCNLIRPGMIFPQMLTGPSYYPPQYQVQMPMFNPFQQMQPTSVPAPNMQQISFPMLTDPTQQSSMVHDFAANSLSCPQLSELSRRSENKGTKGNPLAWQSVMQFKASRFIGSLTSWLWIVTYYNFCYLEKC